MGSPKNSHHKFSVDLPAFRTYDQKPNDTTKYYDKSLANAMTQYLNEI